MKDVYREFVKSSLIIGLILSFSIAVFVGAYLILDFYHQERMLAKKVDNREYIQLKKDSIKKLDNLDISNGKVKLNLKNAIDLVIIKNKNAREQR